MLRTLVTLLALLNMAGAQDGVPPEATGQDSAAIQAAIEEARQELARLEEKYDAEAQELATEIQAATTEAFSLAEQEAELRAQLKKLNEGEFDLLTKLDEAKTETSAAEDQLAAVASELRNQAIDFEERFTTSLLGLDDPVMLEKVEGLKASGEDDELEARIDRMLAAFTRAREGARTAAVFEAPVQLGGDGGKIEDCQVLRLGLLGGYFHHQPTGAAGIVVVDTDNGGRLTGRSDGLAPSQSDAISQMVTSPEGGGFIPFDVTGGAGVASLGTGDSIGRWFEKGGAFMWPLAIVALFAFIVVVERSIALAFRTRGLDAQIRKTIDLVGQGDLEGAEAYTHQIGGPAGRVFRSALTHREQDRSVIEDAVQEALLHETPTFQKCLAFIALCAAVAPLMGLLGTVTGMIETFKNVTIFGTSDPRFMAGGISVALITTQGGLYLAIPCLLSRGLLGAVADGALGRLEAGSMSVVLAILEAREPGPDDDAELPQDEPDDSDMLDLEEDVPDAITQRAKLPTEAPSAPSGGGAE